jgi:uncharacterized protein YceK
MKKIIILFAFILLSGCSTVTSLYERYTIAPFDSYEYTQVTQIRTASIVAITACYDLNTSTENAQSLYNAAYGLKHYSQYIPDNEQTYQLVEKLFIMADDFNNRYLKNEPVNKTYCELKLKSISSAAESIQRVIGKRPRK